jgi:protein tyrosine phosphatase (PTP) superfamily phosphohydrolase (DUF442 family)
LVFLFILCLSLSTRATADTRASARRFAERVLDVRGISYVAEVGKGLYRGGAPDTEGVTWLKKRGIRTVINLRHYHGVREGAKVRAAGMRYETIPLESSDAPETQEIELFMSLVTDASLHPIYVHCKHGVDRTGAMMAVYRMEMEGWSNADALAEMDHFGAHKIWHDLRTFVKTYRPTGKWKKR